MLRGSKVAAGAIMTALRVETQSQKQRPDFIALKRPMQATDRAIFGGFDA
jgi:hypothetical protein